MLTNQKRRAVIKVLDFGFLACILTPVKAFLAPFRQTGEVNADPLLSAPKSRRMRSFTEQ